MFLKFQNGYIFLDHPVYTTPENTVFIVVLVNKLQRQVLRGVCQGRIMKVEKGEAERNKKGDSTQKGA